MNLQSTIEMNADEQKPALVEKLNLEFSALNLTDRLHCLYAHFQADEVMLTSSFAATSALLLKIVTDVNPNQKISFIDTGYHFPETLGYVEKLTDLLQLDVENVRAEQWKRDWTLQDRTWVKDPDLCCSINKVEPLESVKKKHKVWISGLMKWQSDHRSSLNFFEERNGILKCYPLLDVTKEERDQMIAEFNLPFHPLVAKGYHSIGCFHCTIPGDDRNGRWNNHPKTECGLHL